MNRFSEQAYWEDYYEWLLSIIDMDDMSGDYNDLLYSLFSCPFYSIIDYDHNRETDAINLLRIPYKNSIGASNYILESTEISVLEVLIVLAILMENDLMKDEFHPDRTNLWFWDMLFNMGFEKFDDISFDFYEFLDIIRAFLDRTYDRNGVGGCPFIIKNREIDLRKMDLWMQMNEYCIEKF